MNLLKIMEKIEKFVEERKWEKYHKPKNIAISIVIEACELLEHFQWKDLDYKEIEEEKKREIEGEIADVMIYCLLFMKYLESNVEKVIMEKIKKNEEKYKI